MLLAPPSSNSTSKIGITLEIAIAGILFPNNEAPPRNEFQPNVTLDEDEINIDYDDDDGGGDDDGTASVTSSKFSTRFDKRLSSSTTTMDVLEKGQKSMCVCVFKTLYHPINSSFH